LLNLIDRLICSHCKMQASRRDDPEIDENHQK
jgi:hypothetical protein